MVCHGSTLLGVLEKPAVPGDTGLVIVVGGPQYRVGSHRQFVEVARRAAGHGHPALRFDHRGIGDSDGHARPYYALNDDLGAAVDELCARCPTVRRVVLWGLCDGAAAAILYANRDPRVQGLVLLNPWLEAPRARARSLLALTLRQLSNPAFWRRLVRREVRFGRAVRDLVANAWHSLLTEPGADPALLAPGDAWPVQEHMLAGEMARFPGRSLVILSGEDLTARTFRTLMASPGWQQALARATMVEVAGADHTFARRVWSEQVIDETIRWLASLADRR